MIEEFLSKTFATRNIAHREHLFTRSYASHVALGDFYEELIDAVDVVVEAYQGAFGVVGDFKVEDVRPDDIVDHLREESDWIEVNRDSIAGGSNAVGNLVDNVTSCYLKLIYKLENLQ